jgi:hypothetical protein
MDEQEIVIQEQLIIDVFKRDRFECVGCGVAPFVRPITVATKEQIFQISNRYTYDNLITTCSRCFKSGQLKEKYKYAEAIPEKYLSELPDRNDQRSYMFKWQKSLVGKNSYISWELVKIWKQLIKIEADERKILEKVDFLMEKYSFNIIQEAMNMAHKQYLSKNSVDLTPEDVERAFHKIRGIAYNISNADPNLLPINYIIKILKQNGIISSEREILYCKSNIRNAINEEVRFEDLKLIAQEAESLDEFERMIKVML